MNPLGGLGAKSAWRVTTFLFAFACSAAAVWAFGARVVRVSGAGRDGMALDFLPVLRDWSAQIGGSHRPRRVAIVGDSMLFRHEGLPSLADRVGGILGRGRQRDRALVYPLSLPASGPISQYCIADQIIRAKPDLVALEANLRAYEPSALGPFAYPQLAGWIDPSWWSEAALLPMSDADITVNRMILYRLLARTELEPWWVSISDRQARFLNSRDAFESWIKKRVGGLTTGDVNVVAGTLRMISLVTRTVSGDRATPSHREGILGNVFDGLPRDSPRLRVLAAIVRRLHEAGIPTLVWISPINIDFFQSQGVNLDGLERTVRNMRAVVESNGGSLADLRNALTDSQFRDSGDHYTADGESSGTAVLAPRLARMIRRALPEAPKATHPLTGLHALQ